MAVHHISGDGFSMGPLTRDVMVAYEARSRGEVPGWAPLAVQYADYALWQREVLGSEDDAASLISRQVEFWSRALAGLPDQLDLPADRPRPVVAVHSTAALGSFVVIGADVHRRLMDVARESNNSTHVHGGACGVGGVVGSVVGYRSTLRSVHSDCGSW